MDEMEKHQKIDAAIKAHFGWVERLKSAISTGTSEFTPEYAASDTACEFGSWLKANDGLLCKTPGVCEEIRGVHAAFHKKAGDVLGLALKGHRDLACREVVPGSELYALSGRLVVLLRGL